MRFFRLLTQSIYDILINVVADLYNTPTVLRKEPRDRVSLKNRLDLWMGYSNENSNGDPFFFSPDWWD